MYSQILCGGSAEKFRFWLFVGCVCVCFLVWFVFCFLFEGARVECRVEFGQIRVKGVTTQKTVLGYLQTAFGHFG